MSTTSTEPTVIQETSTTVKHMPRWSVILLDTEHHTVEWVITLIMTIFNKDFDDAYAATVKIHTEGQCTVAICHKEKAEMYIELVNGYGADPESSGPQEPLPCVIEPIE